MQKKSSAGNLSIRGDDGEGNRVGVDNMSTPFMISGERKKNITCKDVKHVRA